MPVEYKVNGVSITGYITKPLFARGNRNMQYFFINDRTVQSKTLYAALDAAYKGSIMAGKFPGCILHIAVDPARIDVNVHPTKSVVKFSDENEIFNYMLRAVHKRCAARASSLRPGRIHGPRRSRRKAAIRPAPKRDLSAFFEQEAVQPAMSAPTGPPRPAAGASAFSGQSAFSRTGTTCRDSAAPVNLYGGVPAPPKYDAVSTLADSGARFRSASCRRRSSRRPRRRPACPRSA